MNVMDLFLNQMKSVCPDRMAIQPANGKSVSFSEMHAYAIRAQKYFEDLDLNPTDYVLIAEPPCAEVYALVMALLGLGVRVVLVEPHLPLDQIQTTVHSVAPRIFIAGMMGKIWAARIPAIRDIPHWTSSKKIFHTSRSSSFSSFQKISVPESHPGIITFTSGTTLGSANLGSAKGVVRTHEILQSQTAIIDQTAGMSKFDRPDLTVFPNLVLANLAMGRGSVLVPANWQLNHDQIESSLPATLSCGPGFLKALLDSGVSLRSLQSIHLGGASTDLKLIQKLIERAPQARILQVYGSTEAEPVAVADIADVLVQSRDRGYFQSLYLGQPIKEIKQHDFQDLDLWVAGPHVCRQYLGNDDENKRSKRKTPDGAAFHRMGDHVERDNAGWWYQGRVTQPRALMVLEQSLYTECQSSKSFIHCDPTGLVWLGEDVEGAYKKLPENLKSQLVRAVNVPIVFDRRHRARLDRTQTLHKLHQKESSYEFKDQPALPYI